MERAILTKREDQIACLYAKGMIGKEIAEILHTSYRTIINQTQSIYDKTGIPRCTNAIASWWLCTHFKISFDLTPAAKGIITTILLFILLPREITPHDTYRIKTAYVKTIRNCRRAKEDLTS